MSDLIEINDIAREYIRILHEGDVEGIRKLFLSECILFGTDVDGAPAYMELNKYMEVVAERASPKERGYALVGNVVTIDVVGSNMAFLKLESAVQPRYFIDYLTLLKKEGKWRIASKIYYLVGENA